MPEQTTIDQAIQIALTHHQTGRLQEAEQIYRQILAQQPNCVDAINGLGLIAYHVGRRDVALELFRRATELKPDFAEAHNNLANVLKEAGRFDEAISAASRAVALKPHLAEAHNTLGIALHGKGLLDEAIAAYRQAISIKPNYPEPHLNLGNSLSELTRYEEAITSFRTAIAVRPNYPEAHNNMGRALVGAGRLDEAIAAYRQAVALRPNLPEQYINLGNALCDKGLLDEAIAVFRQGIAANPKSPRAHSNLIYTLLLHPAYDARTISEQHDLWNRQHAQPLYSSAIGHSFPNDRSPDRPLRIGYVSPNFREHVVGRNLLPLFREHDRRLFHITCYSDVPRADNLTLQFQQHTDCWRNILGLSDEQVAAQIRDDRIDLLVDLTLQMPGNRLLVFARKPAPVQVTFAGYPGSTGLKAIDFRLSDPYLDPPGMDESIYSEKTVRLPDSFWCYDPLDCRDIHVQPLPALSAGTITFGCLNNFSKVNQEMLALWAGILRQVVGSRLLLLAHQGELRHRVIDRLKQDGIDSSRIEFAPFRRRREYLHLYHRIDVGLDTVPYNGHTTSLDALWMGVPMVTLVGERVVSRAGWCQLSNLGLTELAAHTPEQYIQIAVDLARDLPRLTNLRSSLRGRMERSPLMDAPKYARNIGASYRQMWQTWCEVRSNPN